MGHQLMLIGQVTKLCVLVRRRASERGGLGMRLLAMLRKVDPRSVLKVAAEPRVGWT